MNDNWQMRPKAKKPAKPGKGFLFSSVTHAGKIFYDFGSPQHYDSGRILFKQGFFSEDVYCINRGLIKLVNLSQQGQEMIIALRSAGWMLGVVSIMIQEPNPVTAITLTDCLLHRIPANDLHHLVINDVGFSSYLHQLHSYEIQDYLSRLVRLKSFSARQRLERLLMQLALSEGEISRQEQVRIHTPLKHWEIAQLISITPQHLSRLLKEMEQEEMIRRERGDLVISDFEKLRTSVDGSAG